MYIKCYRRAVINRSFFTLPNGTGFFHVAAMGSEHHESTDTAMVMPIAIVGMGCRYPGGATSPEKLWEMCAEQRDAWRTIPKERFNAEEFYHPDPSRNGTVSSMAI
jgi:hypothetical protein